MERYIIEVIIFQAIFLAAYWVFFRNSTFFLHNRIYLLVTPFLSCIVPSILIPELQTVVPETISTVFLPEIIIGGDRQIPSEAIAQNTMQWDFTTLYYAGMIISFLVFAFKMLKMRSFFQFRNRGERIVEIPNSTEAFTFLNFIFIGDRIEPLSRKQILAHERIHAQQRHTWDLLIFEVLRIVMWFNPLVYLYQKQLARIHEYLADATAMQETTRKEYYEKLLNTAFGTNNLSFTNTFFKQSFIKNRIDMLQKSKSSKTELFKYALLIPMVLGMLFYVSCSEEVEDKAQTDSEVMQEIRELSQAIARKGNLTDDEVLALKFLSTEAKEGDKIYLSVDEFLEEQKAKGGSLKEPYRLKPGKNGVEIIGLEDEVVSVSIVDEIPIYSGCEGADSNEARKKCMSDKIGEFISKEFDTSIGKEVGLSGKQVIYTLFKINGDGNVYDVRARAPHEKLQKEAERVVNSLPKLAKGARNNGRQVSISYTQPIVFNITE